jgi:predicted transcriptional regulator
MVDLTDDINNLLELIVISESDGIGRYKLKEILEISEGKVRGRLKKLKSDNLITESATGAKLSKKGFLELTEKLNQLGIRKFYFLDQPILELNKLHYLFHITSSNINEKINWLEKRDEAIRGGAESTIFILKSNNKLLIPGVYDDLEEKDPLTFNLINNFFKIRTNELLIISSSQNRWKALKGGLRAIINLF